MKPDGVRSCRWCHYHLGVALPLSDKGTGRLLLCPRCDYTEVGGPPTDNVKDQQPRP